MFQNKLAHSYTAHTADVTYLRLSFCLFNKPSKSHVVSSSELGCDRDMVREQHTETNYLLSVYLTGNFTLRQNK